MSLRTFWRPVVAGLMLGLLATLPAGGAARAEIGDDPPPLGGNMRAFRLNKPARPAPELSFRNALDREKTLEAWHGKVVLLNVWATWCPPCVKELPSLDRLQGQLGGPHFQVVAISVDKNGLQVVEPFLKRKRIENLQPFTDASGRTQSQIRARGIPTTLLIDAEGYEVGRLEGETDWDTQDAIRLIQHYIEKAGPKTIQIGWQPLNSLQPRIWY